MATKGQLELLLPAKELITPKGNIYRSVQFLGAGGNCDTFLVVAAKGPYDGIFFALKVFRRIEDTDRLSRFKKEVQFLLVANHPAILKAHEEGQITADYGKKPTRFPYVVMDYMPERLSDVIPRRSLSIPHKIAFSLQLVSALVHLSALGPRVIHRDIKPDNIFFKGHNCILGDFGLMKYENVGYAADKGALAHSKNAFPFFYRTPDLVDYEVSRKKLTAKSDVFQLGLVLCELFTGKNPCRPPLNNDKKSKVVLDKLQEFPSKMGPRIKETVELMLEFDPKKRPSAQEVLHLWHNLFVEVIGRAHDMNGFVF